MRDALNLAVYHFRQVHGDLTAYGTWLKQRDGWRPCLAIVRTGEELSDRTLPCVVTMDKMWVWSEEFGDEMSAAHMAAGFLDPLRLEPDDKSILKLLSVIRFHIGDVISIPPRPVIERRVVAQATVTDAGGRTTDYEVTEDV